MRRPVPDLFHYTSPAGLKGILVSRRLWFTECRSLNDTSELTYAEQLIRATLMSEIPNVRAEYREWLSAAAGIVGQMAAATQLYVASFCEQGDSLGQWRAYARRGYCIRFSGDAVGNLT